MGFPHRGNFIFLPMNIPPCRLVWGQGGERNTWTRCEAAQPSASAEPSSLAMAYPAEMQIEIKRKRLAERNKSGKNQGRLLYTWKQVHLLWKLAERSGNHITFFISQVVDHWSERKHHNAVFSWALNKFFHFLGGRKHDNSDFTMQITQIMWTESII